MRRGILGVEQGLEEADGIDEGAVPDGDNEVDGIEILVAAEAPGEVGLRIDGGVELGADGAEESEVALGGFGGDVEDAGDEELDGDVVPEAEEKVAAEVPGHGGLLG